MPKYGISVIEFLKKTVIVEAEDLDEAISRVEDEVEKGNIILTDDDYSDREIVPSKYWDGGRVPEGADVGYYWHI
ncbi:MAG: hypothetical protein HFG69_10965 [Hungatella sp.]|nr:hypothetical protein [Hungatella sp.]